MHLSMYCLWAYMRQWWGFDTQMPYVEAEQTKCAKSPDTQWGLTWKHNKF